jgi:hypothetical protein
MDLAPSQLAWLEAKICLAGSQDLPGWKPRFAWLEAKI